MSEVKKWMDGNAHDLFDEMTEERNTFAGHPHQR
jgi:hypothetical protein